MYTLGLPSKFPLLYSISLLNNILQGIFAFSVHQYNVFHVSQVSKLQLK